MIDLNSNSLLIACCQQNQTFCPSPSNYTQAYSHLNFSNIEERTKTLQNYELTINQPEHYHQDFSFYKLMKYKGQRNNVLTQKQLSQDPKSSENHHNNELAFEYSISEVESKFSNKMASNNKIQSASKQQEVTNEIQKMIFNSQKKSNRIKQQFQQKIPETSSKALNQNKDLNNIIISSSPKLDRKSIKDQNLHSSGNHKINNSEFSFKAAINYYDINTSLKGNSENVNTLESDISDSNIKTSKSAKISVSKQKKKLDSRQQKHKLITILTDKSCPYQTIQSNLEKINIQTPSKSSMSKVYNMSTDRTLSSLLKASTFPVKKKRTNELFNKSIQSKFSRATNIIDNNSEGQYRKKVNTMWKSNIMPLNTQRKPAQLKNLLSYKKQKIRQASSLI